MVLIELVRAEKIRVNYFSNFLFLFYNHSNRLYSIYYKYSSRWRKKDLFMVTCTNVGYSLNYNSILKIYFLHYILDFLTNIILNLYICIIRHGFCGTITIPNWLILRYNKVLQLLVTTYSWANLHMLGDYFLDRIILALILIKFISFGMQTSPSTVTWTYIAQFKSNEEKLLF